MKTYVKVVEESRWFEENSILEVKVLEEVETYNVVNVLYSDKFKRKEKEYNRKISPLIEVKNCETIQDLDNYIEYFL